VDISFFSHPKKRPDPPSLWLHHVTWCAIGCIISLFLFINTRVDLQLAVHSSLHARELITMLWFFTLFDALQDFPTYPYVFHSLQGQILP
jgi:hypothetical protein